MRRTFSTAGWPGLAGLLVLFWSNLTPAEEPPAATLAPGLTVQVYQVPDDEDITYVEDFLAAPAGAFVDTSGPPWAFNLDQRRGFKWVGDNPGYAVAGFFKAEAAGRHVFHFVLSVPAITWQRANEHFLLVSYDQAQTACRLIGELEGAPERVDEVFYRRFDAYEGGQQHAIALAAELVPGFYRVKFGGACQLQFGRLGSWPRRNLALDMRQAQAYFLVKAPQRFQALPATPEHFAH